MKRVAGILAFSVVAAGGIIGCESAPPPDRSTYHGYGLSPASGYAQPEPRQIAPTNIQIYAAPAPAAYVPAPLPQPPAPDVSATPVYPVAPATVYQVAPTPVYPVYPQAVADPGTTYYLVPDSGNGVPAQNVTIYSYDDDYYDNGPAFPYYPYGGLPGGRPYRDQPPRPPVGIPDNRGGGSHDGHGGQDFYPPIHNTHGNAGGASAPTRPPANTGGGAVGAPRGGSVSNGTHAPSGTAPVRAVPPHVVPLTPNPPKLAPAPTPKVAMPAYPPMVVPVAPAQPISGRPTAVTPPVTPAQPIPARPTAATPPVAPVAPAAPPAPVVVSATPPVAPPVPPHQPPHDPSQGSHDSSHAASPPPAAPVTPPGKGSTATSH
jgi:hypothetical protein